MGICHLISFSCKELIVNILSFVGPDATRISCRNFHNEGEKTVFHRFFKVDQNENLMIIIEYTL